LVSIGETLKFLISQVITKMDLYFTKQGGCPQMMTKVEFGEWVRRERKSLGLSLRELGEMVSFSHNHISNIENGERSPNLEFCQRFAKVLGINYEDVERYAGLRPTNYIPSEPKTLSPIAEQIADSIKNLPIDDQKLVLKIAELLKSGQINEGSMMGRASPRIMASRQDKAKAPA
jgi:transcriptional regulator with XRE-family HTH domain